MSFKTILLGTAVVVAGFAGWVAYSRNAVREEQRNIASIQDEEIMLAKAQRIGELEKFYNLDMTWPEELEDLGRKYRTVAVQDVFEQNTVGFVGALEDVIRTEEGITVVVDSSEFIVPSLRLVARCHASKLTGELLNADAVFVAARIEKIGRVKRSPDNMDRGVPDEGDYGNLGFSAEEDLVHLLEGECLNIETVPAFSTLESISFEPD